MGSRPVGPQVAVRRTVERGQVGEEVPAKGAVGDAQAVPMRVVVHVWTPGQSQGLTRRAGGFDQRQAMLLADQGVGGRPGLWLDSWRHVAARRQASTRDSVLLPGEQAPVRALPGEVAHLFG